MPDKADSFADFNLKNSGLKAHGDAAEAQRSPLSPVCGIVGIL
jgi:hypothetical protein